MRRLIRFTIVLLLFGLLVVQGPATAYAETQGAGENSPQATEELSSDTSLSSLKIAQAALSPEFAPDQLTYTATVPYEVDRVALTAKTTDPEARKVINGTGDLAVGENTITVTVTSEDGSTRIYRILLTRQAPAEGAETTEEGSETQQSPEETSEEISQESTAAEETTTAGGGIVVETEGEKPEDEEELLDRRTMIILLIAAICLVAIFATVAAIAAFRQRQLDDEDLDEDDLDDLDDEEAKEKFAEPSDEQDDLTDEELFEEEVEFSDIYRQMGRADTGPAADMVLQEIVEELLDRDEDRDEERDDDDLDDDFELLLEEDDDFDFLDF